MHNLIDQLCRMEMRCGGYVTAEDLSAAEHALGPKTVEGTSTVAADVWVDAEQLEKSPQGRTHLYHPVNGLRGPCNGASLTRVLVVAATSTTIAVPLNGAVPAWVTVSGKAVPYRRTPTGIDVTLPAGERAVIELASPQLVHLRP